jgi:hypothetical protein
MCKLVNAEDLDTLTGKGTTHLTEYRMMQKVHGEVKVCEHIMVSQLHYFQKRMDLLIAPDETPSNELQLYQHSTLIFEDLATRLF